MEAHHEVIGYIGCADTEQVVDALVALCERAGLRRTPEAPVPVLGVPQSRDGLTMFAVLPGAPGWQVVLPLREEFLCEPGSPGGPTRFIALCDALRVPGVFREVNAGSDAASAFDAFGQLTLACDGRGEFALSGYMWRASQDADGHAAKSSYLQWYGHILDEEKMQATDLTLVESALPVDWIEDSEALRSDIDEAIACGRLAQRLGGPLTRRYWREGRPWGLVEDAVRLGDAMPVAGGVILGFAAVGAVSTVREERVAAAPPADVTMEALESRAVRGDADAQCEVGLILRTLPAGPPRLEVHEVRQRQLRAATWFRRAAEQGHAAAQFWLGRAHYHSEGAAEDWSEAWFWLQRAAAQGQSDAIAFLAGTVYGNETRLEMMRRVLGPSSDARAQRL